MAVGFRILMALLLGLWWIPGCSRAEEPDQGSTMMLKIPFEPAAENCYSRLKECNNSYREGFDRMLDQAKSSQPVSERLQRIFDIYGPAITEGNAQPSSRTWSEEDVFLCCTFDLMKATFDMELKAIQETEKESRSQKLRDLIQTLEKLPLTGPKWNQVVMPGIKKKLEEARELHE